MIERIEKHLSEMALIPALSGYEQKMAAYMKAAYESFGLEVQIDTLGNCIAKKQGTDPNAPTVMVFSHMDNLGFLVRKIEDDGFIRIERLGGIPEKALPATQVQVQARDGRMIEGVIGIKAHHVTPPEEKYVVDKYMTLFVDIGARSREEVLALGIHVGSPIVYKPKFQKLLGTRAVMTFSDNRSGCSCNLELAARLKDKPVESTIYFVGTVLEEYNLRGGMMAARTVKPDVAICLDGGGGADTPDMKANGGSRMGEGPSMSMYNFHGRGTLNGTIPHPAMVRLFEQVSEEENIPLQYTARLGGLTDMSYVQLEDTGVIGVDIGYPGRYTHSPCEVVDMSDIDKMADLVEAALLKINASTDFSR